ncbi:methyl-accepting chemotaxis protein [Alkalibacter mobilis]|uniref:methyl-accepting chemotaxis protein n=1 Tax=Alkalibacter mobilis TaxID=2787712 RepID=UPI00189DFC95|nr:methyl-accepting chemotaxis protein [Alkalibacter mobilis]MBF7097515.1 hypothetical protein [Alkalibacter mobilis]
MLFKNMTYKSKIIFGISLATILVMAATNLSLYFNMEETIRDEERMRLNNIAKTIKLKESALIDEAKSAVLAVAGNKEVQKAFANRDREALIYMLEGSYLSIEDKIAQFQFHLPDSTSFLRLHNPEKFGDSLKDFRFTVNEANETEKMVSGIEEGVGGYGFRVVVPIKYEGVHQGTVEMGADIGESFLLGIKESFTNGDFYLYSIKESLVSSDDGKESKWIASTSEEDPFIVEESDLAKIRENKTVVLNLDKINVLLIPMTDYKGEVTGYYKGVFDRGANVATLAGILLKVGIFSFMGIITIILITYLISKKIFSEIENFQDMFSKLALGDLRVKYPIEKVNCSEIMDCGVSDCPEFKKDGVLCWFEVGSYAPQYGKTVHCPKIINKEYESCHQCKVYKKVNKNEMDTLGAWFNNFAKELNRFMRKIYDISQDLSASSEELHASGTAIAMSAEEVGNSIEQMASGSQEQSAQAEETLEITKLLANDITDIKSNSEKMGEQANTVSESLEQGDKEIDISVIRINEVKENSTQTANNIEELRASSEKIGEIIGLISNISDQTNLLALNAAIEAARAGDAGKGFSVVAEEVRKLAEESSVAADEISKLIKTIQSEVLEAVENMNKTENAVSTSVRSIEGVKSSYGVIRKASSRLESLIKEISEKTIKISTNSNQVERSINEIAIVSEEAARSVQDIAAQGQEQTASTEEIVSSSEALSNMASELVESLNIYRW